MPNYDLGLLGGADKAVEGFISAWEKGEDRKLREMELQAKLKSEQENSARNSYLDQLRSMEVFGNLGKTYDLSGQQGVVAPQNGGVVAPSQGMVSGPFGMKKRQEIVDQEQAETDYKKAQTKALDAKTKALNDKKNKLGGGKQLTDSAVTSLAGYDSADVQLNDIQAGLSDMKGQVGPIAGRLNSINPYATSAQAFDAKMNLAAQEIGKNLEGGKLAEGDISRYRKMLPNSWDTPEVAAKKILIVRDLIETKRNAALKNYKAAGYSVNGLMNKDSIDKKENKISKEDQQAIDWAKKNPNDSRSKQILKLHGL